MILRCVVLGTALFFAGCGVPQGTLMVTPLIYREDGIDPFAHVDSAHRTPAQLVFYATNRSRASGPFDDPRAYGNTPSSTLQLGMARVRFGDDLTWEDLSEASRASDRKLKVAMRLTDVWEHASISLTDADFLPSPTDGSERFLSAVNAQLALAKDPEIIIYVHGAKVNFYNACIYAAELNHFAGRDMVPLAFAWPTHQDIFRYLSGEDIERGKASVGTFVSLIRILAQHTSARRINIVCWSAGGRVVSRALEKLEIWDELHDLAPTESRLGTVVFAAPDVPVHDFVQRLPKIDQVAERVIVIASDDDIALEKASTLMGGGLRMGTAVGQMPDEEREAIERDMRIELLDVSQGKDVRGFDIAGHRYWFSHDWISSDLVLAVRPRLPASKRGLAPSSIKNVWYFPVDYPQRVRAAAKDALGGSW